MRLVIERLVALACVVGVHFAIASIGVAQVGEVMESDDDSGAEANNDRRAARISARDPGGYDGSQDDNPDDSDDSDELDDDESAAPTPYRVGAGNGIEVGGHMLINHFTIPKQPSLQTGLGFSGRIATTVYDDIVAEASVGMMFNKDNTEGSYQAASLRLGARMPLDFEADPLVFFVGTGAALQFLSSTTAAVGMSVVELESSAITASVDLQFGAIYGITETFAVEVLVQGTYGFSNVVWLNHDASWVSLSAGVSYDL